MKIGVVNTKSFMTSGYRIDPDIHLSEGAAVRKQLRNLPYELTNVGECASKVFLGNIFSRIFVKDKAHGVPYLAASDTVLSNIETGRFLAKKQANELSYLMLKKDWILITCSGTLGNVTYTNSTFENHLATHDLIRVVPNDVNVNKGTLYAFLAGKYGYYQITQSQFGGVVKHINDAQASSIIVPVLPEQLQKDVNTLIQEAAILREEATTALDKAHHMIEDYINFVPHTPTHQFNIQNILNSHTKRFEGSYYSSECSQVYDHVSKMEHSTLKNCVVKIYRPGIFKRQYVKDGVTFLGGADILLAIPDSEKNLSFKQVEQMPELTLKEGWILVTCGGTIGNTVYVDKQLSKCAVSQHVIRIVPKEGVKKGFLYAFLSSKVGYKLITRDTYGSVIPQIEPHHIERIPIPQFPTDLEAEVDELVMTYANKLSMSKSNERKAISMVEQEIEKWNK